MRKQKISENQVVIKLKEKSDGQWGTDRPSRKMGGNDLRVCFRKDPNRTISEDSPGMIQIGAFDELMNKEAKKNKMGHFSKGFPEMQG
jgi:hypothetical protein